MPVAFIPPCLLPQKENIPPLHKGHLFVPCTPSHTPIQEKPMAQAISFSCIQFSRPQRHMSAAALSAAVDSTKLQGTAPNSQAEPTPKNRPNPNASRSSGGSAREGLLSEKPPPSHTPFLLTSTRRGRRIRGSAVRRRCGRLAGAAHPARGWSRGDQPDSPRFHRRHPLNGPSSHRSAD